MESTFSNPTILGLIAIAISSAGTILGLFLTYKKDQRVADQSDLEKAQDRLDIIEQKLIKRDELIDEQAEIIRELRDKLSERDRTIADQKREINQLRTRVTKLEKHNAQ